MVSIPSIQPHPQESELRNRIAILETENRDLRQRLQWEKRLFSNPHISPAQKLALWATVPTLEPNKMTHVNITYVSKQIGMSAKTTGRNLQQIAEANGLTRQIEPIILETGEQQTRVYFAPTEQTARPHLIEPPQPRNHGGARKHCKDCGSENLMEQVTITCMDCGAEQHRTRRSVNIPETASQVDYQESAPEQQEAAPEPLANLTQVIQPEEPLANLTTGNQEPTTPPTLDTQETLQGQKDRVISLLLDIAGDSNEHIVMNDGSAPLFTDFPKKYKTIHKPLQLSDIRDHLTGEKTIGGNLSHADGTARALCFDTDNEAGLQLFRVAMCNLHSTGVKPVLEISPAGRGGHLWIIFSSHVNAQVAYRHVCGIAPELQEIREYWPCEVNQKVRLLGGKYVTPDFAAWPIILDASGAEIIKTDLLDYQTPADLVPDYQEPESPTQIIPTGHRIAADTRPRPAEGIDTYHQQKYPQNRFWFVWTPEQLAVWYNERNNITDQLPPERNGYGLAAWRGERSASVAYTKDGLGWVDFGAGAQKPDGKRDGGDSLELAARLEQKSKSEIMREAARQLLQEARIAMENAAHTGAQPPAWLLPFITEAGWKHYEELGGVAGFSTEQEITPPAIQKNLSAENQAEQKTCTYQSQEPEHKPAVTWYTANNPVGSDGIPRRCCQCAKATVWYDGESYCEAHWREKKQRAGEPIFDV